MNDPQLPSKSRASGVKRERAHAVLGWAFAISLVVHLITLPFFGLKAQAEEQHEAPIVRMDHRHRLSMPTPPPPTPTPVPPTPPPAHTPPPVRASASPPPSHRTIHVVTTHHTSDARGDHRYMANTGGTHDTDHMGVDTNGTPGPAASADATASPAPTAPPPTATPKPACANPNASAGIKGQAIEPVVPDLAKEQGAAGTTEVEVALDENGNAVSVTVHKSSGFLALDNAALQAARATTYYAETVDCVKTAGRYLFRADFDSQ